jgi:two-component system, cell cycle sensor histidine kinase and response regulator CckA
MSEQTSSESIMSEIEHQHRSLAEKLRDAVWMMGLDGRFTYVSPLITAQTGFSPEEHIGQPVEMFLAPESASRVTDIMRNQLALPREQRMESLILELQQKTKAGSVVDVEANATWMYDDAGNAVGIIGVTREISARKRAERALKESEERFRTFSSLSTEGIVIHDNGIIIDANQAAAVMAGYLNPEALIGKHGLRDIPFTPESRKAL